jgi:hypothetical protein
MIYQKAKNGKTVLMRLMTMRDFFMPFCLAFSDSSGKEKGVIFEIYNPKNDDRHDYIPINGTYSNKSLTLYLTFTLFHVLDSKHTLFLNNKFG